MDSCGTHTEPGLKVSTWTICYLSTWKATPLLSPRQFLLCLDVFSSALAPGELARLHSKGFELSIIVIFKNHFKVKLLYCLSCVCQSWVYVEAQSRQHHELL